jgi:hypothetical protein
MKLIDNVWKKKSKKNESIDLPYPPRDDKELINIARTIEYISEHCEQKNKHNYIIAKCPCCGEDLIIKPLRSADEKD